MQADDYVAILLDAVIEDDFIAGSGFGFVRELLQDVHAGRAAGLEEEGDGEGLSSGKRTGSFEGELGFSDKICGTAGAAIGVSELATY